MPDFFKIPVDEALAAYQAAKSPTLTETLLYAILAQLCRANAILEDLGEKEPEA